MEAGNLKPDRFPADRIYPPWPGHAKSDSIPRTHQIRIPISVADMQETSVAPTTANNPKRVRKSFLFGASDPMAPI